MLNAFLSELTACVPHYSIAELKWSLESRKKNHAQQHFISHWKCDPSICCIFHSFKSVNSPHFRIEKKKSKEDKKTYPTQKKSMRKLNNKCKKNVILQRISLILLHGCRCIRTRTKFQILHRRVFSLSDNNYVFILNKTCMKLDRGRQSVFHANFSYRK